MPGPGAPYTKLDYEQVIQQVFDESADALRTNATFTGTLEVHLDPDTDGVYIGDGTNNLVVNPDGSLNSDVNIVSSITLPVSSTNLDIRSLSTSRDSVNTLNLNSLVPVAFDSILASYPTATQEVYVYQLSASTVATVTVDYVDSTKAQLVSVVRT